MNATWWTTTPILRLSSGMRVCHCASVSEEASAASARAPCSRRSAKRVCLPARSGCRNLRVTRHNSRHKLSFRIARAAVRGVFPRYGEVPCQSHARASDLSSRSSAIGARLARSSGAHARASGSRVHEGRRALRRASRRPSDRRAVLRLRAELSLGARGAAVVRDRAQGDAWRAARHRVPHDRARLVLGTRGRRRADATARRRSDRVSARRCARPVERARDARGARHVRVRAPVDAAAVRLRVRRRRRAIVRGSSARSWAATNVRTIRCSPRCRA